jgi:dienelactone hydrolase
VTRWLSIVVLTAVVTGCGGDDGGAVPAVTTTTAPVATTTTTRSPSAAPEVVESCPGAGAGWRSLDVRAHGQLSAAVLGGGDLGVVLANDSGNDQCDWMALARELANHGMRALVFRFRSSQQYDQEVLAAARALRGAGAQRVAAIGASLGGRAVVQAAASDGQTLAAAISLSAEREIRRYPEILPVARRIHVPSLYVGSEEDVFTELGRDTRDFHRVTPAEVNEILLVPGRDHGVNLLSGAHGPRVRDAIFDFLTAVR